MKTKKGLHLIFFLIATILSVSVFPESEGLIKKPLLRDKILTEDQKITLPIKRIFYSMGISAENDLKDVVKITQQKWLKTNDRAKTDEIDKRRENYIYQLKEIGCVDRILPSKKNYHYCLLLGGQYQTFVSRLEYLIDKWEKGVRFKSLVFLGEKRVLDFEREKKFILNHPNKQLRMKAAQRMPQTEMEMMKFIYDNIEIPREMRTLKTVFIDGAMHVSNNENSFPDIYDSVISWLNMEKPMTGACLVVSSQPYVGFQESVVRSALSNNFEVEAVGMEASPDTRMSLYLDTLARWFYQEALMNDIISPNENVSDVKKR